MCACKHTNWHAHENLAPQVRCKHIQNYCSRLTNMGLKHQHFRYLPHNSSGHAVVTILASKQVVLL